VFNTNSPAKTTEIPVTKLTAERFVGGGVAISGIAVPASAPFGRNAHDRAFFENAIGVEWRKQVGSIVATGKCLLQAKEELNEHDFAALKLPFSTRISQMLRQIASNLVLSDPANFSSLPACWRTLVLLARLSDQRLKAMIADGRIHPKLKQKEARTLCGLPPGGTRKGNGHDHAGDDQQEDNEPDPVMIWSAFSDAAKTAILASEERAGLAKLLPPDVMVDLVDCCLRQQMFDACTKLKPAVTLTAMLRATLDPANDAVAVFEKFNAKLVSFGLDLHHISIAITGTRRPRGKRRRRA
jgi:hypothetical protein